MKVILEHLDDDDAAVIADELRSAMGAATFTPAALIALLAAVEFNGIDAGFNAADYTADQLQELLARLRSVFDEPIPRGPAE